MRFPLPSLAATRWLSAVLVPLVIAGCGAWPLGPQEVDVALYAVFPGSARKVQATITPYTVAEVAHLYLQVFKLVGSGDEAVETPLLNAQNVPIVLHIARDDANQTLVDVPRVVLTRLQYDTPYRVKAFAYADGTDQTGTLISVEGPGSQTALTLSRGEAPAVFQAAIQVQLANRTFDGKARGTTVTITPGGFTGVAPTLYVAGGAR